MNKNSGFGQAANLGAKLTKTKNIFFCSPDNFSEKNTINKLENLSKELKDKFGILILSDENECPKNIQQVKKPKECCVFL